ncbi:hypothetical protein Abp1_0047 [Acinetobacter phage Abp1]|uniref:Tail fiber protein n=1 Tax=Acinetobacter phage Abp1 TaxID=1235824 RepID=R4IPZ0_9CAUD|nr:tail fiber protein [Acinetobacter phage Abp1]AFV51022.1 hypothetical protein Abp1_0047 [Acinetobacter phage Abp1]
MNILRSFTETVVTTPTDLFPISFEYDEKYDAVHVFLNDVAVEDLGYTVSQVNAVTLKVEPAITEGTVRIERETDIDKMKYIFDAGALFIDQNVDADFRQIVHSQQEVRDGFIKLRGDVLPLVHSLQEALQQAQEASEAAQEAANAAEVAASQTQYYLKYFNPEIVYPKNARIMLDNGDIVKSTVPNNTNNPNSDMTGWVEVNSASQIIDESGLNQQEINNGVKSAAALRLLNPNGEGERIYLTSFNEGQGEGGGVFISKNKGTLVDDGGTILQSSNASIVYVRINFDSLTPEMFGAKGDDISFDNYLALQAAFKHPLPLEIPPKTYYTTRSIWYTSGKKIKGSGHQKSVICKTTNSTETDLPPSFAKDAVIIARYWSANDYAHYCEFDGFLVTSTVKCEFGLYAPRIAESSFSNFKIHNAIKGFYSDDAWMISMIRVTSSSDRPYIVNMGTSITMNSCWAINARGESSYCYEFNNLYYSTLISCGADNNGLDGSPIKALYRVLNSSITFISCASENNHAYKIFHGQGASVTIVKMTAMRFYNKYKVSNPVWGNENALFDLRSETRLDIKDSAFDGLLNTDTSTSPSWINITDTSYLNYSNVRVNIPITGASVNDTTAFGVKWGSATTVILDFGTYKIESCVNLPSNLYNPLSTPTNETYSSIFTRGSVRENGQELSTEDLNNLRYLGTITFKQSKSAGATLANNYPENGGAWVIQQYSDVATNSSNVNTNTTQIAIRKDSNRIYFRCAPYGGIFTPWYKIYHSGNTTVDANGFLKAI